MLFNNTLNLFLCQEQIVNFINAALVLETVAFYVGRKE